MHPARCRVAVTFLVLALTSSALLLACGGKSARSLNEPGDDGACALCADSGTPVGPDATAECPALFCGAGFILEVDDGECVCALVDSSVMADASPVQDASVDSAYYDGSQGPYLPDASYPDGSTFDAFSPPADAYAPFEAAIYEDAYFPFESGPICPPDFCGNGYVPNQYCECIPCAETCPVGQTPGVACNGCVACSYTCPAGFDVGFNCGCVPHGVDAGTLPVDAGDGGDGGSGVTCLLEGSRPCNAGSWCELGVCPDNTTQYGCYCNLDGTATCDVNCPAPPPCTIPGEGTCPYGASCVYGSCAENQSDSLFVCSCESGGSAYCYTTSCADGGPFLPDAGNPGNGNDGGVTCLLEGYDSCNAGSFCALGTCPDGTTQYGCFCNEDGTATCNLVCPPPPPCDIPGEGSCPYGSQCIYGTCNGNVGTRLSCNCYGGVADCYTYSCASDVGD